MTAPDKKTHDEAHGVKAVHDRMDKCDNPKDRFLAFANGVLDNAVALDASGATADQKAAAIAHLRANLESAWQRIQG